jgi:hypothetical protein
VRVALLVGELSTEARRTAATPLGVKPPRVVELSLIRLPSRINH